MIVKDAIKKFEPLCEQEIVDKKAILDFIDNNEDCLDRTNLIAHLTSSAFVVNHNMTKILFAHHNLFNSWSWVGGHNDGDNNPLRVAIKEAKEETGIKTIQVYSEDIFTIDVIYVENHIKNGKYVPDHIHLNTAYLLIGVETDDLIVKSDENSGVRWFLIDEVLEHVSEERIKTVYSKAFKRIRNIKS